MKDTSRNNLNDEISLKEIFLFLYNGRLAIFSITGAIAMASIVYVMMITPVYEAKITFKPISHSNLSKINSRKYSELKEYDRTFIAGLVRNIARSNQLIANISTPLPQVDAQSVAPDSYYINKLKFEEIKETTLVSIQGDDPSLIATYLNNFVYALNKQSLSELKLIEKNRVSLYLQNLIVKKAAEVNKVKSLNSEKLSELNMNISMAKALNKKKGYLSQLTKDSRLSGIQSLPDWYVHGQDTLQKRLKFLTELQENNSSKEIAIIDSNIEQLKSFKVDFGDTQLVNYSPSTVPTGSIYPHKKQIVIIATIIAFFLSILFVYIRKIFSKN